MEHFLVYILIAILEQIKVNIDKGYISKEYGEKVIDNFIKYIFAQPELIENVKQKY